MSIKTYKQSAYETTYEVCVRKKDENGYLNIDWINVSAKNRKDCRELVESIGYEIIDIEYLTGPYKP